MSIDDAFAGRVAGVSVKSKNTLNAKNLEALGAERLAELLIEISTGNAAAKRRLRLALAGVQSPGEVAKEVRKQLTTIARSRSFVDWQKRRTLVEDLETQRAIVDQVAKADPAEALVEADLFRCARVPTAASGSDLYRLRTTISMLARRQATARESEPRRDGRSA